MSTKTVPFSVEVKDITITSGSYAVYGIVQPYVGVAITTSPFQGSTFSCNFIEEQSQSGYFAIMVYISSYTLSDGTQITLNDPINLLATFYLPDADYTVKVTPESTIASIYTFAQMMNVNVMGGNYDLRWFSCTQRQAKIAYGLKQNIYKTAGAIADMIKLSPNGFETNSYPMLNSMCNLFYYSLTDTSFYSQFLNYAWHKNDAPNTNFIQAVRNIVYDPFTNATAIYNMLVGKEEIYGDSLTSMNVPDDEKAPNQWTLTLKNNSSGAKNFLPSGLAYVVFDADDNAWVANNFRMGSNLSGTHCPVYKYDATPADFSPVQGGGLLGAAFGAAIDPAKQYISIGNFGWGPELFNPQEGSISRFYYKDGKPVSPSNGYTEGLSRVQGMNYDNAGNLWMASVGCQDPFAPAPTGVYPFGSEPSAVVVYMKGTPTADGIPTTSQVLICDEFPVKHSASGSVVNMRTPYLKIFDVQPDNNGNAYVSCIGNYDSDVPDNCILSAVYKVAIENNRLVVKSSWYSDYEKDSGKTGFESLRQVAINSAGDAVVVGVTSSRATVIGEDPQGNLTTKGYYDVNTYAPWGIKIDGNQTVFLANFGEETDYASDDSLDMKGPFGVTMLRDTSNPASAQLLTVPTGGAEVMLANGHPLYGTQTRPVAPDSKLEPVRMQCYQPIMRLTATNIDGAGNLWCMNNWKPSKAVDVADNPGGDGVVIFLGIAKPE